jgi:hypothetical protein
MGVPVVNARPAHPVPDHRGAEARRRDAVSDLNVSLPAGFTFNLAGISGSVPDAVGFLRYLDERMVGSALARCWSWAAPPPAAGAGRTTLDFPLLALQAAADEIRNTATFGQGA